MSDKKELNEELEKVSGGTPGRETPKFVCQSCDAAFDNSKGQHTVTYGSGCDERKYVKCPFCGYENS